MTTAARPTFEPARGGRGKSEGDLSAISKQYSSRDLPAHQKLKYRYGLCLTLLPNLSITLIWGPACIAGGWVFVHDFSINEALRFHWVS
jgi:hypothetical protein